MKSFWTDLPTPFTVLAPMEGVTDVVFRKIITEIGRPDLFFTEFTSCAGLLSSGAEKVAENFLIDKDQAPIVAQIWGTDPKEFFEIAKQLSKSDFSGIDINMGCPVKAVTKHGACGGLIRTPELAMEIIQATIEGAGEKPVSVKTRLGYEKIDIEQWVGLLLRQNLAALTIHLRTVHEMSRVPAHWEVLPQILSLRDKLSPSTIIVANGDLNTLQEIDEKYNSYKAEGYMVGTGIFANPWLFNKEIEMDQISVPTRINLFLHHIELFEKQWNGERNFAQLKKFAKTYISNFPNSASFREILMDSENIEELKNQLENYTVSN